MRYYPVLHYMNVDAQLKLNTENHFLVSGVQSAVNVKKNHESITVKEGDSYDLLCEATDVDVKACAFITPYGQTYVLWPAAK